MVNQYSNWNGKSKSQPLYLFLSQHMQRLGQCSRKPVLHVYHRGVWIRACGTVGGLNPQRWCHGDDNLQIASNPIMASKPHITPHVTAWLRKVPFSRMQKTASCSALPWDECTYLAISVQWEETASLITFQRELEWNSCGESKCHSNVSVNQQDQGTYVFPDCALKEGHSPVTRLTGTHRLSELERWRLSGLISPLWFL